MKADMTYALSLPTISHCRPSSGDSGYYSRPPPPPTILRRSPSPVEPVDTDNPFANYRTFDEFRSTKHGQGRTGSSWHNTKHRSDVM